ncbi:MAG TPA: hypothetical protein PLB90_15990 [Opitutaceae bacterium]|nr:hypothetical protein [Opitutaceae bacterium]
MKPTYLIPLVIGLLAGCTTPYRAPSDVAHIRLAPVDSAVVKVEKIWLERDAGQLVVTGYVLKRLGGPDTRGTHLDVTLYDARGAVLRRAQAAFSPAELVPNFRHHPHGTYRVELDPLPAGTATIEVRAHEGAEGALGGKLSAVSSKR